MAGNTNVVPRPTLEFFEYATAHASVWAANATNIGLSSAMTTQYTAQITAARNAYYAQQAAKEAAKVATRTADAQETLARAATADLIAAIRGFAKNQKDPLTVYNLAQVPPPATPAPLPAPGVPFDFKASLETSGAVTLKWKMPSGTTGNIVYVIERRVGNTGSYVQLPPVGKRTFTDKSIPAGATQVSYRITAQRSDNVGQPGTYTVLFGTGGVGVAGETGENFSITGFEGEGSAKLAA